MASAVTRNDSVAGVHATSAGPTRRVATINAALFIIALVLIAAAIVRFAALPSLRSSIDATKTRAYSLSQQTHNLLGYLNGQWTVALLLVEERLNQADRRQLDEVLERYTATSDNIEIVRIDPTDPASLTEYEDLLSRLRGLYAEPIRAYDEAIDAGLAAFDEFVISAQREVSRAHTITDAVSEPSPSRETITSIAAELTSVITGADSITEQIRAARSVSESQPIPNYEHARSELAGVLNQISNRLINLVDGYQGVARATSRNSELGRFAQLAARETEELAQRLAIAADPLVQLPDLELVSIGLQLGTGDAAVVIGGDRAAVIPARQLFPQVNQSTGVSFDRRFRGEQLITSTIQSLLVEHMPRVVFVHNSPQSLLTRNDSKTDLIGAREMLSAARIATSEWDVLEQDRPATPAGQPVVWVVVPPSGALDLAREQPLVDAARALIADGESVLLSLNPSMWPQFGRADPWVQAAAALNVRPDTAHVVCEQINLGGGETTIERAQFLDAFATDHDICRAIHGQQTYFSLPVPLHRRADLGSTTLTSLASIAPSRNRWLEDDWNVSNINQLVAPDDESRLNDVVDVALAVERPSPIGEGTQRGIVVGSGGWMLSFIADAVIDLGGGRAALTNPGNQELLLAGVYWLAGMDELIAPSPVSQQVARLDGVSNSVWLRWLVLTTIVLPLGSLAFGSAVWFVRRR